MLHRGFGLHCYYLKLSDIYRSYMAHFSWGSFKSHGFLKNTVCVFYQL